jgi:hypothetical protein
MTKIQAYSDGYDAYLRLHSEPSGGERSPAGDEEPHSPYVDDPKLYRAWLEGWKGAGGRSRLTNELTRAMLAPLPPSVVPTLGAVWPMPVRTVTAPQCRLRC